MTPLQRRRNPFVNRMAEDMQIRNLAASTVDSYTWHVDKFCSHFGKMPEELGPEEIRQYQIFLVHEKKASWRNGTVVSGRLRTFPIDSRRDL